MIRSIGNRLFQFSNKAITFQNKYSKGFKSFMTIDDNIKTISFQDFRQSLEIPDQDLAEKFKKADNSSLFELKDGFAKIILDNFNTETSQENSTDNHFQMFYNLAQIVERDITLLVANENFREKESLNSEYGGSKILILNAGSGVKPIRFLQELDQSYLKNITLVEKSKNFADYFNLMSKYNKIDTSKIEVINQSFDQFYTNKMVHKLNYKKSDLYDFIDIESYGSSMSSIRQSLKLVKDGGMISAMFGDMQSTSGPDIAKCFTEYNIIRCKVSAEYENAARIIYSSIQDAASQNNQYIEPILTFKSDFYIKVFFRVHQSIIEEEKSIVKKSFVYQCSSCPNFHVHNVASVHKQIDQNSKNQKKLDNSSLDIKINPIQVPQRCDICDSEWRLNGPIWNGALYNYQFIKKLQTILNSANNDIIFSKNRKIHLQSIAKLKAYIDVVLENKQFQNQILAVSIKDINGFFRSARFPQIDNIKRALARHGYKINRSEFQISKFKTDAPNDVIFDILKVWKKLMDKQKMDPYNQKFNQQKLNNIQSDQDNSKPYLNKQQSDVPLNNALRKQFKYQCSFKQFTFAEKEQIQEKFNDPYYFEEQKVLFYPNPNQNWEQKESIKVLTTHKYEKQTIYEEEENEDNLHDLKQDNKNKEREKVDKDNTN